MRLLGLHADRLSHDCRGYRQILDRYVLPVLGGRKVRALRPAELDELYARLLVAEERDPDLVLFLQLRGRNGRSAR